MDQIKHRDQKIFLKTAFSPGRVLGMLLLGVLTFSGFGGLMSGQTGGIFLVLLPVSGILWMVHNAYQRSIPLRWHNPRFRELYRACQDRHVRLKAALKEIKRHQIADLQELPISADKLLADIYLALRRADIVYEEVIRSESHTAPPIAGAHGRLISDAQAQELFRVADKNIAEYGQHFKRVIAGVERAEAQAAVFATTLDTLRVRMLGYRLLKESPEADTREFLEVVTEAKMQFEAIDKALEEIELTPYPETITVIPDSTPTKFQPSNQERQRAEQELDSQLPPENLDAPDPRDQFKSPPPIPPYAHPKQQEQDHSTESQST